MKMNRRQFIQGGAATAAALAALSLPGAGALAATRQRVIVIGAGMAGIACANALVASGHTVTVLEARDRIGGRIFTSHKWADMPIDMGASWIHEMDGNPLTPIAQSAGLAMVGTDLDSLTTFYKTQGKISNDVGTYYDTVYNDWAAAIKRGYNTSTETSLRSFLESSKGLNYAGRDSMYREFASHLTVSWGDDDYCGDSAELSCWYWDSMSEYNGLDAILPGGYIQVVEYLARGLDIRLNQIVSKVAYTSTGVTVTTAAGTFTGDRVVVTVPLSILKKGAIAFSPALPTSKLNAIGKIGFGTGTLEKIWLRFPSVFWDMSTDWIEHIKPEADRGSYSQFFNVARSTGKPVLCGFNGGYLGLAKEGTSDAQVVAEAMASLREMYGAGIPDPVDYQLSHWSSDPYAGGSYSFNKVGSTPAMRDTLAANINSRVFFAGEATQRDFFATAHGAYLSGRRAATEINKA